MPFLAFRGGQHVKAKPYNAISEATPNPVCNAVVQSFAIIRSREVLWQSSITLSICIAGQHANTCASKYAVTDALAPLPSHS